MIIVLRDDVEQVEESVSLVANVCDMARELGCSPESMARRLISESPRFTRRMAALWRSREASLVEV